MIITTSHASYINNKIYEAPANTIVEELIKLKKDFIYIRHSLDGKLPSTIYFYKKGRLEKEKKIWTISKISVLRYLTELMMTILEIATLKEEKITFIGVDPLNALAGIILKLLHKVDFVVYYTTDYSPQRFTNPLLNNIFHWIERFDTKKADANWSVSYRIWQIKETLGIKPEKNILVPNVPSSEYIKYLGNKKEKSRIITLGIIDEQLDFINTFKAIKLLKDKYKDIQLLIAGTGPREKEYIDFVKKEKLEKNIKFLGHLDHDKALKEISKSGIGLALYTGVWGFNYYGDSMKCREYFCFGLPAITTDTHSTVEDIKENKAGVVVEKKPEVYAKAIEEIITNYDSYTKNAYNLSKRYEGIHKKLLSELSD